ncbi:MAG TPA: hypothetical protein VNJ01_18310 [Bacteriovoracaceae bacterium]|nr:hypothetical protein [Bacteriovoracaceae bacterium]
MMKFTFGLLFFISACTIPTATPKDKKYVQMYDLWKLNPSREDVLNAFGTTFEAKGDGVIYRPSQHKSSIDSGHFFGPTGLLEEQFILISKTDLENLKQQRPCPWREKSEMKSIGHSVQVIESGVCASIGISYEYFPSMLLYEVRWKK